MFFGFSIAFNTIQPLLLRDTLVQTGVDPHLTAWILDYLTDRTSPLVPVSIQGLDIEIVKYYKYLGVHLNNKLDWADHAHALDKKRTEQTLSAEETEVLWSAGSTPEDLL